MAKTATVSMRIDEQTKHDTEEVLQSLGLNMSTAFNMFCKQIVAKQGLPFRVQKSTPVGGTINITNMSEDELAQEIANGLKSASTNKLYSANAVMQEMHERYGI